MTVVRVREATHQTLSELARETHRPMGDVLDNAVEQYRRAVILDAADLAYSAWRNANPQDDDERAWEGTLRDGLAD
jgi:predicted transcriptional regulator